MDVSFVLQKGPVHFELRTGRARLGRMDVIVNPVGNGLWVCPSERSLSGDADALCLLQFRGLREL